MTVKTCKKPTRNSAKRGKIRGWFELAPSRQPLQHKALWELESDLMEKSTVSPITIDRISTHYSSFSSLYSDSYLWLDYSNFLYSSYELRSVSAYPFIRKLDYVKDVYSDQIESLFDQLLEYYLVYLSILPKNIIKSKLYDVCTWFIYHLNRVVSGGYYGIKFSYSKNFYSSYDCGETNRLSGRVIQNLMDFLVKFKGAILYKGYSINVSEHEKSSCMSLLLLPKEITSEFGNPKKAREYSKVVHKDTSESVKIFHEVRDGGKNKMVINIDDYEDCWLDKVYTTERILKDHHKILSDCTVMIGKYEIPLHHFKRIWIGDVHTYGRIHDDGTFQTKSKTLRKGIIIDQEPTVTIDLSSLHPRLLYTMEGIELPDAFDPYPNINIELDRKRLNRFKKYYNIKEYNPVRNLVKVGMLILINAKSDVSALKALEKKLEADKGKLQTRREAEMQFIGIPEDINLKDVLSEIKSHNAGIKKYFAKGMAKELMGKDSDILIEAIDCLVQLDIVCLPLHDSLTVKKSFEDECVKALQYGYKKVMGSLMNFKCGKE